MRHHDFHERNAVIMYQLTNVQILSAYDYHYLSSKSQQPLYMTSVLVMVMMYVLFVVIYRDRVGNVYSLRRNTCILPHILSQNLIE